MIGSPDTRLTRVDIPTDNKCHGGTGYISNMVPSTKLGNLQFTTVSLISAVSVFIEFDEFVWLWT